MRLQRLIQELPEANVFGPVNRDVRGIACQAQRVGLDMVYVALPDDRRDPWEEAAYAVHRGATAVICQQEALISRRATRIQVPDVREALARAARSYYGRPSSRLFVVGVEAGVHGSFVASLLHAMMQASGRKTGLLTSVEHLAGDRPLPLWPYLPQSLEVQQSLAHMAGAECEACVVEISREEAERKQFLGVDFDVWVRADLDGHPGDLGLTDAPGPSRFSSVLHQFKEWDKRKAAVINIDAVFGSRFSRVWTPAVQLTDGTPVPSLLRAGQLQLGLHGSRFVVSVPERCYDCCLPSLYVEDVYNALSTIQVARSIGLGDAAIQAGLRWHRGIPGRLEKIDLAQPFHVFVDRASTPEELRVTLHALKRVCEGRLRVLVGQAGGTSCADRQEVGRLTAYLADHTVLTSDNPGRESAMDIIQTMVEGYEATRSDSLDIVPDRQEAIERILTSAGPGDCVLLAGKGSTTVQELRDTILPFDDRARARVALETLGYLGEA